jgi:hypothetical protein
MDYGSEYGSTYDYGLLLWVIVLGNLVMGNVVMRYGHFDWIQIGLVLWSDFSSVLKISDIHVLLLSHTKKEFLVMGNPVMRFGSFRIGICQDLDLSYFGSLKIRISQDLDFSGFGSLRIRISQVFFKAIVLWVIRLWDSHPIFFLDAQDSK